MRLKSALLGLFALVSTGFSWLPNSAFGTDYTFPLVDQTGLNPSEYSLYVMGFSIASNMVLGPDGTFISQSSGTVSSYPIGSGAGEISELVLDADTPFTGGRIYFFVVPEGDPAPSVTYGQQPANPPATSFPPYNIIEITVPPLNGDQPQPATVDVQTVDGFVFPLSITLNGNTNVAGQQFGQPIYSPGQNPTVNRLAIFDAYTSFMQSQGSAGTPYLDLVYGQGTFANQPLGILNPGAFLTEQSPSGEYVNLDSPLHTVFNSAINTLFSTSTLRIQGSASGAGQEPVIPPQSYMVSSTGNQPYPGANLPVAPFTPIQLPALELIGEQDGTSFTVFNPVGVAILNNDSGDAITGTISGTELTLNSAVTGLEVGMWVNGAGTNASNGEAENFITAINGNVLTLNENLSNPTANSQYSFSKLPYLAMFQTPGQMVFANSGVFADSTIQSTAGTGTATVLGSLENWIVSALNRGVAINPTALNPTTAGGTGAFWGDQRNWYPAGSAQNLFSLFMHAGQISTTPIFFQPLNAASWPNARSQVMGSAYGFAYDENGGPVPPAPSGQPEVPSKFDQNIQPGATIQVTFGPWTATPTPTPTPSPKPTPTPAPEPNPKATVKGKKKITTSAKNVKLQGTAVGEFVYIQYKKPNGKLITKRMRIKPNGNWVFKFKPKQRKTILRVYAENSDNQKSKTTKVRVIDKRF